MKTATAKKPKKPRVCLLSLLQDRRIKSVSISLRLDGRLLFLFELNDGFSVVNLFKESTSQFAVGALADVPSLLCYVQPCEASK